MVGEVPFLAAPVGCLTGKEVVKGAGEGFLVVGQVATTNPAEELEIPFLLTGNEMVDEHGTASGEGLVYGGTAGLPNHQVVFAQELWNFP